MSTYKLEKLIALSLILAIGLFYLSTIRDGHDWDGDHSMYIQHARNIVEGSDYRESGYIFNPSCPSWGPESYPPVFPLLLSPLYRLYGLNLKANSSFLRASLQCWGFLLTYFIDTSFSNELINCRHRSLSPCKNFSDSYDKKTIAWL